ncbi:sensor histidine kinase [uncultured Pseudokineococcus sp.]|uniref:sensor histidine kinase n=1 Tax=uncultured Pseudokineococcus sp. TaxID=1642928 RepID=UPI002629EFEE|nr:histidine kinase [uncultured Pseudokineococcus sp.]
MTRGGRAARRPRTQVEWVELYTDQSLHVLLWFMPVVFLTQLLRQERPEQEVAVLLVAAVVLLGLAATTALRAGLRLHPADGPTPWPQLLPLLVGSGLATAGVLLLPYGLRLGAALLVWFPLVWSLSALRARPWAVAVVLASAAVPATSGRPSLVAICVLGGVFVLFTIRVSLWLKDVVRQLDRARGTRAALAVAEERLRFSRDVHDVMGRRLATIAVQSELASTLAARGDARAAESMLEVRGVAHATLKEVRELARGYRASDLATELDGAASLLSSAGIELVVEVDVDDVPPERREPAAWVVREAVTNVLRHSRAGRVVVTWDGGAVVVLNDGVLAEPGGDGPEPRSGAGGGNGLVGLRERLAPLGGDVTADRDGDAFVLRADLGRRAAVSG